MVTAPPDVRAASPSGAGGRAVGHGRAAPLVAGVVLAGAAAYVAFRDPATQAGFVPCPLHRMTGLWCPACGLTRGVHALLTGHPLAAIGENLFTPLVVLAAVAGWAAWLLRRWNLAAWRPALGHRGQTALAAVLVVYGLARNVPAGPLRALAP
jgi:hypothetical protein